MKYISYMFSALVLLLAGFISGHYLWPTIVTQQERVQVPIVGNNEIENCTGRGGSYEAYNKQNPYGKYYLIRKCTVPETTLEFSDSLQ